MAAPIVDALNPTMGDSLVERFMPLVVASATVIVAVAAILGYIPGMDPVSGLALLTGSGAGYAVRSQG